MSFSKLVLSAQKIARKHMDLSSQITEAFIARYGITFSDIDADELIEAFDYGGGDCFTVHEIDKIMTSKGYPPLSSSKTKDGTELSENQISEIRTEIESALKKVDADMKQWKRDSAVDPIKMITPIKRL